MCFVWQLNEVTLEGIGMNKILTGILLALINSASASAALIFYADETAFNSANPGLVTEDFEGGVVGENFTGPANNTTTNIGALGSTIYSAGDIVPGIEFNSPRRADPPFTHNYNLRLADLNSSVALATPSSLNFLSIDFSVDVTAVSFDVFQLSVVGADPNDIAIRVFGVSGLLDEATLAANNITPVFFGVFSSTDYITRIEIDDANITPTIQTLANIAAIDNVAFGNPGIVPIPTAVWLFGSGLMGLIGLAKRKAR
jgi:hypothetical protein